MEFFIVVLSCLDVLVAVAIVVLILIRRSKSGGGFVVSSGSDSANSLFGVHTDLHLNRLLTTLVILFFIITFCILFITAKIYS